MNGNNHQLPSQISLIDGTSAKYCADANLFYEFWIPTRQFPLEHYSTLWDYVSEKVDAGIITSTEEVYREIKQFNNEDFQKWLAARKNRLYVEDDMAVIALADEIVNKYPQLLFQKKKNGADPFVVATGKVYGLTVITQEIAATPAELKSGMCPKVPNLCDEYGVKHVNILRFCGTEGFALGPVFNE